MAAIRYVALLRGINIGSKKRIAMADLRTLIGSLGHTGVLTYVNSGNAVFTGAPGANEEIAGEIAAALQSRHGLDVPVVVRSGDELREIVAANPFPEVAATPKLLHVSFLGQVPDPSLVEALAGFERGDDRYVVSGQEVYVHYPHGLARATFMPNGFDRALKVTSTSRNWNTVLKLAGMASDPA